MRARRVAGMVLVALAAAPPALAHALTPPDLIYREGQSENEASGPWLALEGASIAGLGFVLGTTAQAKPAQDSATYYRLTALEVPDGHPDQGAAFDPSRSCQSSARPAGTQIVLALPRYEGPGRYVFRIDAQLPSEGATPSSCSGGASSTVSFTIDPAVVLELRATAPVVLGDRPFAVLAAIPSLPGGGIGQTQCALDAQVQADGSVTGARTTKLLGSSVRSRDIPQAGRWTCVGRATRGGSEFDADGPHYTRWSPPLSFDAVERFAATLRVLNRRPHFRLAFVELPAGSVGGTVRLRIYPGEHCPFVRARTLTATIGPRRRVRFSFVLPERHKADLAHGRSGIDSYGWMFRLSFGGTDLVRAIRMRPLAAFLLPHRFQYGDVLNIPDNPTNEPSYCTRTT